MRIGRWINGQYLPAFATPKVIKPTHAEQLEAARLGALADYCSGLGWGKSLNDCPCPDCRREYAEAWDEAEAAEVEQRK
jgi:hypothetical protein